MEKKENIGSRIENVVRRKQIGMSEFAKQLGCRRENIYNIFKRNSIDIELLAKISEILDYNFFDDVSKDYDLALPTVVDELEEERRRAVMKFLDVFPNIMNKLNYNGTILIGSQLYDTQSIDYVLCPGIFTFTIDETIQERLKGSRDHILSFSEISDENGHTVLLCENKLNHSQSINIKLVYRTDEEWEELFKFVLSTSERYYNAFTKASINDLIIS